MGKQSMFNGIVLRGVGRINRVAGKGTGVMGSANLDIAPIVSEVIESMGEGVAVGQTGPVMVIDGDGLLGVGVPFPIELTD